MRRCLSGAAKNAAGHTRPLRLPYPHTGHGPGPRIHARNQANQKDPKHQGCQTNRRVLELEVLAADDQVRQGHGDAPQGHGPQQGPEQPPIGRGVLGYRGPRPRGPPPTANPTPRLHAPRMKSNRPLQEPADPMLPVFGAELRAGIFEVTIT
jgi:hypothetical protein